MTRPGSATVFLLCPGAPGASQPGWQIRIPYCRIADVLTQHMLGFVGWGIYSWPLPPPLTLPRPFKHGGSSLRFSHFESRQDSKWPQLQTFGRRGKSHNKLELVRSGLWSGTKARLADVGLWCGSDRPRQDFSLDTYAAAPEPVNGMG